MPSSECAHVSIELAEVAYYRLELQRTRIPFFFNKKERMKVQKKERSIHAHVVGVLLEVVCCWRWCAAGGGVLLEVVCASSGNAATGHWVNAYGMCAVSGSFASSSVSSPSSSTS